MILKKEEFKILFTFLQEMIKEISFKQVGDTVEVSADLSPKDWYELGKKVGGMQSTGITGKPEEIILNETAPSKKKFIHPRWLKSYYILAIALFILLYAFFNTQSATKDLQLLTEKNITEIKSSLDKKLLDDTITNKLPKRKNNFK